MTRTTEGAVRTASQAPAYRMATFLIGMGTTHFLAPQFFDTIVPAELPGRQRHYTRASGAAEIATGMLLALPRSRKLGGLAAATLFFAVFPGNVNMVRLWWGKPWPMRLIAIARLPLQAPLVTAALKIRRNA